MLLCIAISRLAAAQSDPLPDWNDGAAKHAITDFVAAVTKDGAADFVPLPERIAVFDNDGTLWPEQPIYVQEVFALDRVRALAPLHPDWKDREPFKAALDNDLKGLAASGEAGMVEIVAATHAGMTEDAFRQIVGNWFEGATHPRFKRRYDDLAYQPMRELLAYLRGAGFKTYIVSGGGIDFMRPVSEAMYGIPPEQVIGSSIKTIFVLQDGKPELLRQPQIDFVDDGAGKPVAIDKFIGRRPIAAFGNSDGDLAMLQWTTAGPGRRFALVVHHTDAEREYAYDRASPVGRLDRTLDEAQAKGWTVVDMKNDWNTIFAPAPGSTDPGVAGSSSPAGGQQP